MTSLMTYSRQNGVSLIEVLVAVFVLAAGLFGLASLQMYNMKNINNVQFNTLATEYAYEMAERMRSNRDGIANAAYDAIDSTESDPSCNPCTSTQIAQYDAFIWNQQLKSSVSEGGLPEGKGTVTKVGNVYQITVSWKELQADNLKADQDESFTLNIQI